LQTSCSTSYYLDGSDPNGDLKDARKGLAIFYQTVIIFIALCLAIAFIVYGSVVIWMLARIKSMSRKLASMKRNKMIKVPFPSPFLFFLFFLRISISFHYFSLRWCW
jgi:hypothetical protein